MPAFVLHPRLEADSFFLCDLPLCQVRINNQKAVPWLVLIPRREDVREVFALSESDQTQLMREIVEMSKTLEILYKPDKINIGALGNIVPQLHIHVIARFKKDPAWPNPVWGNVPNAPYSEDERAAVLQKINGAVVGV